MGEEAPLVASRLRSVCVFRAGALVTRELAISSNGSGALPEQVRVTGLPLSLDDGSVRARVVGQGVELPVVSALRVALDVARGHEELKPPENEELVAARVRVARLDGEVACRQLQLERIRALKLQERPEPKRGEAPIASPIQARLALLDLRDAELERLEQSHAALERTLAEARRQLVELEDRERRSTSARQAREHELRKTALICFEGRRDLAAVDVELQYAVPGAYWAPAYTIRLDPDLSRARLELRALVCQRSGEDWSGVGLQLSTATPQRWTKVPELKALKIGRAQAEPTKRGWRAPPEGAEVLYQDYDRAVSRLKLGANELCSPDERTALQAEAKREEEARIAAMRQAEMERARAEAEMQARMEALAAQQSHERAMVAAERKSRSRGLMRKAHAPGGMPPPAAMPMSAPAPAPAAPAPTAAAPLDLAAAVASLGVAEETAFGGVADEPTSSALDAEAAGVAASDELLDYGSLRLASPQAEKRGKLAPVSTRQKYLELTHELTVSLELSVESVIQLAYDDARDLPPPPDGYHVAESPDSFDYLYRAEVPLDVPSNGEHVSVPVVRGDSDARPVYVVVPRESTDVFTTVTLESPLQGPLLPGPADVYVGSDYRLTAPIRATPVGSEVELGLGVEQAIKVARNSTFSEETEGLIRGSLVLRHVVTIEVQNHLPHVAHVQVRERIPSSREGDSDVKVVVDDVRPKWEPYEQAVQPIAGSHRWNVKLQPGAKSDLRLAYSVRIPGKHELIGGNRREA